MFQNIKNSIQHYRAKSLELKNKPLHSVELGLLASKVFLLLYLAVGGSEAAQVRIPFVLAALEAVSAQIEKRLEASKEEEQEKRPAKTE